MLVSLIIPAYNEEKRLRFTLEQYSRCLQEHYPNDYEILVIANGCMDHTMQIAKAFSLDHPCVKAIDIPEAIGKGGAILEGFCLATGQYIIFADADCATRPVSLIALIDQLPSTDIVIGSRWMPGSKIVHQQPFNRRVFSRLFNLTVRLVFHLPYHDTQCGAKGFRRTTVLNLSQVVKERNWTFDVDLLLWASFFNYRVKEFPVTWEDKAGSTLKVRSTCKNVISSLWHLKRRRMKLIWKQKMVHPLEKVQL